jgi:hypothetical protein
MRRGVGRRQRSAKDTAADVARQDRRQEVLALTVDGLTTRAVGQRLGISHVQVIRDLRLALEERNTESKEHGRALAKERIDAIIQANMQAARGGFSLMKIDSGKLVLNAIALDAKINGYESPKQLEHTGKDGGAIQSIISLDDLTSAMATAVSNESTGDAGGKR